MDALIKKLAILVEIADRKTGRRGRLGKTAMQKLLFLLQDVYKVNCGYYFQLYTYGPYDSTVMQDIDYAQDIGLLNVEYREDRGYEIRPGAKADAVENERATIREELEDRLDDLFKNFGDMNAKDLELRATLLYVRLRGGKQSDEAVVATTAKLKPGFSEPAIKSAFEELKESGVLARVA